MRSTFYLLFLTSVAIFYSAAATAAPIQPGSASYDYRNEFITRVFPGIPGFKPGDFEIISEGVFVTEWGQQDGNQIKFEITSAVANGEFFGAPFKIFAGIDEVPLLGPFVGTYSNIVQDKNDPGFPTGEPSSLLSADVSIAGPFSQVLADGTTLYTITPYTFEGPISGLPYPVGTQFIGTEVEVLLQLGPTPDPSTDPVIGLALAGGVVEVTRVIPEPSSLLCTWLCGCLFVLAARRSRTAVKNIGGR